MKKYVLAVVILLGVFTGISQSTQAQVHFYVNVRPTAPVIVRPAPPSPRHIWVEDEWTYRNGAYVRVPGYWAAPPRGRRAWVAGHWEHERRGHYWVAGHWR